MTETVPLSTTEVFAEVPPPTAPAAPAVEALVTTTATTGSEATGRSWFLDSLNKLFGGPREISVLERKAESLGKSIQESYATIENTNKALEGLRASKPMAAAEYDKAEAAYRKAHKAHDAAGRDGNPYEMLNALEKAYAAESNYESICQGEAACLATIDRAKKSLGRHQVKASAEGLFKQEAIRKLLESNGDRVQVAPGVFARYSKESVPETDDRTTLVEHVLGKFILEQRAKALRDHAHVGKGNQDSGAYWDANEELRSLPKSVRGNIEPDQRAAALQKALLNQKYYQARALQSDIEKSQVPLPAAALSPKQFQALAKFAESPGPKGYDALAAARLLEPRDRPPMNRATVRFPNGDPKQPVEIFIQDPTGKTVHAFKEDPRYRSTEKNHTYVCPSTDPNCRFGLRVRFSGPEWDQSGRFDGVLFNPDKSGQVTQPNLGVLTPLHGTAGDYRLLRAPTETRPYLAGEPTRLTQSATFPDLAFLLRNNLVQWDDLQKAGFQPRALLDYLFSRSKWPL